MDYYEKAKEVLDQAGLVYIENYGRYGNHYMLLDKDGMIIVDDFAPSYKIGVIELCNRLRETLYDQIYGEEHNKI